MHGKAPRDVEAMGEQGVVVEAHTHYRDAAAGRATGRRKNSVQTEEQRRQCKSHLVTLGFLAGSKMVNFGVYLPCFHSQLHSKTVALLFTARSPARVFTSTV